MKKINQLKKYNLKVIEDNAESIGGKFYKSLMAMSDLSTLSFFANKIITTGEGGILTNNKNLYEKCLEMRDHGMIGIKDIFINFLDLIIE